MALSSKPRVLFANPPWWGSREVCRLSDEEQFSLQTAGVRAGSRWPFTYTGRSTPGIRDLSDYVPYPFFMGYAASYLARTGAYVRLRDSIAFRETYDAFLLYLLRNRFDVIFLESASPSWDHDRVLIREIRRMFPQVVIAVTGPIATRGAVVLEESGADAAIKGEYEKGAVRVVEGARGVIDFDLLTTDEMNAAPFPWLDSYIWDKYWDSNPKGQLAPQLQLWSSRGCPYKCIFCVWPAAMTGNDPDGTGKRAVRHYTPEYMSALLDDHIGSFLRPGAAHGFRSIYFDDDTFNLGDRHVLSMCSVLERFSVPWSAMCRADTVKRETWRAMKQAGCFGVKIGFESGNQEVIDRIVNKRLDLAEAKDTVAYLHSIGLSVHGTFTYGLPGETAEQRLDTKRYIRELEAVGMDTYQESGCAEIEGAPLETLAHRGSLVAFPGARRDSGYRPMTDGAVKLRAISSSVVAVEDEYPGNEIEGWMEPDELRWLYRMAREMSSIVEIGSFQGRSTHALLSGCRGIVVAVDHFNPVHLRPVENDWVFRKFEKNMAGFSRLVVNRKDSLEAAEEYPDLSFDAVFIDGHHTYEAFSADLRAWRGKARRLLCGHDYCGGWPGVVKAVDELLGPVKVCGTIWYQELS